jgi:hypothetical protein
MCGYMMPGSAYRCQVTPDEREDEYLLPIVMSYAPLTFRDGRINFTRSAFWIGPAFCQ